jgi:hypothetical protein
VSSNLGNNCSRNTQSPRVTDVQALVDSGTTDNFISPTLVKQCRIHTRTLEEPRTIRNVDGTKNTNGEADTVVLLEIKYKGNFTAQTFFVIDLGDDHMLLGMPFLAATNPEIDWTKGIFPGDIQAATPHQEKPRLLPRR